jgi:hypothetical protein
LNNIPIHFSNVETGTFVIMPDHIHGIIFITGEHRGEVLLPCNGLNQNNLLVAEDLTKTLGGETPPLRKPTLGQIVA